MYKAGKPIQPYNNQTVSTSAGVISKGSYTDNGDGTLTLEEHVVSLYNNPTYSGNPIPYYIPPTTLSINNVGVTNYVVAKYNDGSPVMVVITDVLEINESDIIPILTISVPYANQLNIFDWDELGNGLSNKLNQRLVKTQRFARESGFGLDVSGLNLNVNEGILWAGANRLEHNRVVMGVDTTILLYKSGGVWSTTPITALENFYYQGATDLEELHNDNRYVVNWIYRCVSRVQNKVVIVLSQESYTLVEAQASQPPAVPAFLLSNTLLVGRIVYQKGVSVPAIVNSAFDIPFTADLTTLNHSDLNNVQGDGEVHLSPEQREYVVTMPEITKEASGFYNNANITMTYDQATRTVTLTGSGWSAYWRGLVVPELTDGWVSPPIPDINPTNPWFLWYDGLIEQFVWSPTPWSYDKIMIIYVSYNSDGVFNFALREPHGLMPYLVHEQEHQTNGTYVLSGGTLTNFILDDVNNRQPHVVATLVKDEDIITSNAALTTAAYTHFYLNGSVVNMTNDNPQIVPVSGNNPYWNSFDGTSWGQTLLNNNEHMSVWLVAIPTTNDIKSQKHRFMWIQGQSAGSFDSQRATTLADVNLSLFRNQQPEWVTLAKIIIKYSGNNWSITEVEYISGSNRFQVTLPQGNFLSTVTSDTTLTGSGTTADPLGVVGVPNWTTATRPVGVEGLIGINQTTNLLEWYSDGLWRTVSIESSSNPSEW